MPCTRIVVHAGFHKTGTTSIQSFLSKNRHTLKSKADIFFPMGRFYNGNHDELSGACLRRERETGFKIRTKYDGTAEFNTLQFILDDFAKNLSESTMLFSSEGVSYLRYADEIEKLDRLLPAAERHFIFYRRNAADWQRSFQAEVAWAGEPKDRDAWNYVADDSWLLRFDERIDAFRKVFGPDAVTVIDYDASVAADRSVIPSFLRALNIADYFEPWQWQDIWDNSRFASRRV
jgi:hypothetical protein